MLNLMAKIDLVKPRTLSIEQANGVTFWQCVVVIAILFVVGICIASFCHGRLPEILNIVMIPAIVVIACYIADVGNPFSNNNLRRISVEVNTESDYFHTYFDNKDELLSLQNGKHSVLKGNHFSQEGDKLFFSKIVNKKELVYADSSTLRDQDILEDGLGFDALKWMQTIYKKTGKDPIDTAIEQSKN